MFQNKCNRYIVILFIHNRNWAGGK